MEKNAHETIRLQIDEEVARLLEYRLIPEENVQKVIHHAEQTGDKFVNPATGRTLACLRPVRVNYWVEYSKEGDHYRVHRAYSHRMEAKR